MLTGYALKRFSYFIPIMIRFPLRVRVFHESPFLSIRDNDKAIIKKCRDPVKKTDGILALNL